MKSLLLRIQKLPDRQRKIIFWMVIAVLAITLSGLYIKYIQKKVAGFNMEKTKEEVNIHSLEGIIDKIQGIEIPKIEMPEINQETLQELERMTKEIPEETPSEIPDKTSEEAPIE